MKDILKKNRVRITAWSAALALLVLPLVAMQFTNEVVWGQEDFIFASLLIVIVGIVYELVVRLTSNRKHRVIVTVALTVMFLLVWIEAAVGIFGPG